MGRDWSRRNEWEGREWGDASSAVGESGAEFWNADSGATGPTLMFSEGSPPGWPVRIPGALTLAFGAR
jgi:hypothetical protein